LPKCLLPVRGIPMLEIWLEICERFAITEVLINIHAHADLVRSFLQTTRYRNKVHVIEEPELLGSAGTLRANRSWLNGDDRFWVFYADVLHQVNLGGMLDAHERGDPAATIGVYRVPDPTRCGIVQLDKNGIIIEFVEKPSRPKSDLAFAGLLVGTPSLLDAIPDKHPVDIGFDVLPRLTGKMLAYEISSYITDIGTVDNYNQAQASWPGFQASKTS